MQTVLAVGRRVPCRRGLNLVSRCLSTSTSTDKPVKEAPAVETAPAPVVAEAQPTVESESRVVQSPDSLSVKLGAYWDITRDERDQHFPEMMSGRYDEELDIVGSYGTFLRAPSVQLLDLLKNPDTRTNNKILIEGKRGVGKSHVLNQAVYWARKNGWRVLNFSSGGDMANRNMFLKPSANLHDTYDQPYMGERVLDWILMPNRWILDLPYPGTFTFESGKRSGVKFNDIAAAAYTNSEYSTAAVLAFLEMLPTIPGPWLLAIDGYNAWFDTSDIVRRPRDFVHATKLRLIQAIQKLPASFYKSGNVLLCAESWDGKYAPTSYFDKELYARDRRKFGKRVKVAEYSVEETKMVLDSYVARGALKHPEVSPQLYASIRMVNSNNPQRIMNYCKRI